MILGATSACPQLWVLGPFNIAGLSEIIAFWVVMWKCHFLLSALLAGPSLLCDGVRKRRRSHVPHPEVQKV